MQALYQYAVQPDSREEILEFNWVRSDIYREIIKFATDEFNGLIGQLSLIDRMISDHLSGWKDDRIGRIERAILRIGVYELLFADDIPVTATISECLNLANRFGNDDSYKFINGVLDAVASRTGKSKERSGQS